MPDVVKHAWTHRPRSEGGTDPIEVPESGSAGQWCRIYSAGSGAQTVAIGDRDVVSFGTVNNPYTDYFGVDQAELVDDSAITILQSGVYAFTYRLYIDSLPDVPFTTEMNGIDWDEFLYYERTHDPSALTGFSAHDSFTFRSAGDYGQEPPKLYVIAGVPASAASALVIGNGHAGPSEDAAGTYLEIIRLAPAPITGDPTP